MQAARPRHFYIRKDSEKTTIRIVIGREGRRTTATNTTAGRYSYLYPSLATELTATPRWVLLRNPPMFVLLATLKQLGWDVAVMLHLFRGFRVGGLGFSGPSRVRRM